MHDPSPAVQKQDKPPPELKVLLAKAEAKRAAAAASRPASTNPSRRTTAQRTESAGPFWDFPDDDRGSSMPGEAAATAPEPPVMEPLGSDQGTVRLARAPLSSWQVRCALCCAV